MIYAHSSKDYLYMELIYDGKDAGPFLSSCLRPPSESIAEG